MEYCCKGVVIYALQFGFRAKLQNSSRLNAWLSLNTGDRHLILIWKTPHNYRMTDDDISIQGLHSGLNSGIVIIPEIAVTACFMR